MMDFNDFPESVKRMMKIGSGMLMTLETLFDQIDEELDDDAAKMALRISFVRLVSEALKPSNCSVETRIEEAPQNNMSLEQIGDIIKRKFGDIDLNAYKLEDDE